MEATPTNQFPTPERLCQCTPTTARISNALNHFGLDGQIHNGFAADEHLGDRGWNRTAAETLPPIVPRGVLGDVAAAKGVETLEPGYRIRGVDLGGQCFLICSMKRGADRRSKSQIYDRISRSGIGPDALTGTHRNCIAVDEMSALKTFCRVIEEDSFSAAARKLRVSNAAVSKNISELEAALGAQLIIRTTRSLRLTDVGADFHARIKAVLEGLEEAKTVVSNQNRHVSGVLSVALPMSFGIVAIVPLLKAFRAAHPDLRLHLNFDDIKTDVVAGRFDVAIRGSSELPDSSLKARRLLDFDRVLCAAPTYFSGRTVPKAPDEMRNHDCIAYLLGEETDAWLAEGPDGPMHIRFKPLLEMNNSLAIRQATLDGHGIAALPLPYVRDHLASGALVRVLPAYRMRQQSLFAVYPSARHMPPKTRLFIDYLVDALADLSDIA